MYHEDYEGGGHHRPAHLARKSPLKVAPPPLAQEERVQEGKLEDEENVLKQCRCSGEVQGPKVHAAKEPQAHDYHGCQEGQVAEYPKT